MAGGKFITVTDPIWAMISTNIAERVTSIFYSNLDLLSIPPSFFGYFFHLDSLSESP